MTGCWPRRLPPLLLTSLLLLPAAATPPSQEAETKPIPLPTIPALGWKLGTRLFGGWNSNPLDLPGGPSDYEYSLGADASYGFGGRRSALGLSLAGTYRSYKEFESLRMLGWGLRVSLVRSTSLEGIHARDHGRAHL